MRVYGSHGNSSIAFLPPLWSHTVAWHSASHLFLERYQRFEGRVEPKDLRGEDSASELLSRFQMFEHTLCVYVFKILVLL